MGVEVVVGCDGVDELWDIEWFDAEDISWVPEGVDADARVAVSGWGRGKCPRPGDIGCFSCDSASTAIPITGTTAALGECTDEAL